MCIRDRISGEGKLGPIVSGELDVDRMDYLLRDSYNTGVAYGVIDYEKMCIRDRYITILFLQMVIMLFI